MTGTELAWARALLGALDIAPTDGAEQALVAVAVQEGTRAADNPDDTTEPEPGTTDYNTVGVRNYPSWNIGVEATAATLRNGLYQPILNALAAGKPANVVVAWAHSSWGTWSGDQAAALRTLAAVQANWPHYAAQAVPGAGPATAGLPLRTKGSPMDTVVTPDGTLHVFCASPAGHLLHFVPNPHDPSGWSVTDVTDALLNAYPHAGPYLVA